MLARIFAAALAATVPVSAMAQECAPIDQVGQYLAEEYGEVPLITGAINDEASIFIFVNPKTRTFSVVTVVNGCAATDDMIYGGEWLRIGRQI